MCLIMIMNGIGLTRTRERSYQTWIVCLLHTFIRCDYLLKLVDDVNIDRNMSTYILGKCYLNQRTKVQTNAITNDFYCNNNPNLFESKALKKFIFLLL